MAKRFFLFMAFVVATLTQIVGQNTVGDMFVNAPADVMPMLPRNTRLDMIDYFKSSLPNASDNLLQGKSKILALTDDHIEIELSRASKCELSLLPMGKDTIAVYIETLATPVSDSSIRFVSRSWRQLKTLISEPKLSDWLTAEGVRRRQDVEDAVPFILAEYHYDTTAKQLTITNNMSEYFTAEDYATIAPLLKKRLVYSWTGKRMMLMK